MLGARGWMTSWTGSDVDDGGTFLFWRPLPGGRGITAVAEAGYKPWLSASWYSAACLASASFFPTTNLGSGRSLTGETGIRSRRIRGRIWQTGFSRCKYSPSCTKICDVANFLNPASCSCFSYLLSTLSRMPGTESWTFCSQLCFRGGCTEWRGSERYTEAASSK